MDMENRKGRVYIIGAGPGDPGLITIKGSECLKKADVIVYDYLSNERFLKYAKEGAETIYVGKKGACHTKRQNEINTILVEKSNQGKSVARLKGGDPFIFGRGGEEALVLAKEGIPFEIIPGVSSAVAAPAYAGIPLTHREYNSTVAFITGHEDPAKKDSKIAWDKIATGIETLVFLMTVTNLKNTVERLLRYGKDPETPVALVRWGTRPEQETLVGRLHNIVKLALEKDLKPPVVAVVGEVVNLRAKLNWFEKKPLFGKRILVTRTREQAGEFSEALRQSGAEPIEFPTIEVIPPDSWDAVDKAIEELATYDWIIFTSTNGVKFFIDRLYSLNRDIRELKGIKICAIGPKTSQAIKSLGIRVDMVPDKFIAEEVIEALGKNTISGGRFLLPRALVAREILPQEIQRLGGRIDVVPVYQTVRPVQDKEKIKDMIKSGGIDMVTFTSSSTVKNFTEIFGKDADRLLNSTAVACIGPVTAKTAKEKGLKVSVTAKDYTTAGLIEASKEFYSNNRAKNLCAL